MRLTKYEPNKNSMFPYKLRDEEPRTELDTIHKLGQLEDIEEELGIDLVTLFKALKDGIYVRLDKDNEIDFIEQLSMDNITEEPCFYYCNENTINLGGLIHPSYTELYFKDYSKTWALTKEELL